MSRRYRGQAAVELALILPVMLLILMGMLDLGRLFYYEEAMANAAREGARYGAANPDKTKADIIEKTKAEAPDITSSALTVDVNCSDITSGKNRKVTVEYQFELMTPIMQGIVGNQIKLSATSSMPTSSYAVTAGCT